MKTSNQFADFPPLAFFMGIYFAQFEKYVPVYFINVSENIFPNIRNLAVIISVSTFLFMIKTSSMLVYNASKILPLAKVFVYIKRKKNQVFLLLCLQYILLTLQLGNSKYGQNNT